MSSEEKPKIIVDDDWKTRVQAEKEAIAQGKSPAEAAGEGAGASDSEESGHDELPPPTFDSLVSMLVTPALMALGQIPIGEEQKPIIMLDHAKNYIDLLGMLEEKTKGNLSSSEAAMLTGVLHELRMVYVAVSKRA